MEDNKIEVIDKITDGITIRYLLVNGKEESATYIDDRKYELVYPYSLHIADEMKKVDCEKVLLLGGGGFSIPKYFISNHQTGKIDVVEKFEDIYEIAKKNFFVSDLMEEYKTDENGHLNVYITDAKEYLKSSKEIYNMIVNDAYDGGEMVPDLLTEETVELISSHLEMKGIYIINFFSALEGVKRKTWDIEEQILNKYFSKTEIRQVNPNLLKEHRQNCIVIAVK